ncbi:DUF4774 domain-containing protein, partial [Aquaspirillum serpens]|uniref:DUF4774 domain-containing protein n=1 Tax=Aquaspirillum serpens TaxID=190 RepID=UPI001B7FCE37
QGTATAGRRGTATAGRRGTATAGWYGTATAGHHGTATAGHQGTATAGNHGTATAESQGTAVVGSYGKAEAISGSIETGQFSLGVMLNDGVLSLGTECLGFIRINPNFDASPSDDSRFKAGLLSRIRIRLPDRSIITVVIDGEAYLPDVFYTLNPKGEVVEWKEDGSHRTPTVQTPLNMPRWKD